MGYYMDGSKQEQIVILLINFMKREYSIREETSHFDNANMTAIAYNKMVLSGQMEMENCTLVLMAL